jgi:hypothetical protein
LTRRAESDDHEGSWPLGQTPFYATRLTTKRARPQLDPQVDIERMDLKVQNRADQCCRLHRLELLSEVK